MTETPDTQGEPDARELLDRCLGFLARASRNWHVPVLGLVLGVLGFAVFSYFHVPRYRSDTVILYAERGSSDDSGGESAELERSASVRLKELLFARSNLERVVRRFDLYPELRAHFGMGEAVEELKKHVEFKAPGGDTFSIAFEGEAASQVQRVTGQLAQSVIDGDSQLRRDQAKVALDFLQSEKHGTETQLREAEQQLAAFMAKHPRFALDATPLANGAAIRATLGGGPARAVASPAWSARPRASGETGPAPAMAPSQPVASDPEEARARAALAAAREHLTEQQARYTPAHPDVRAAEAELSRATQRLASLTGAAPAKPAAPPPVAASPAPSSNASAVSHAAPPPRPAMAVALTPPLAAGAQAQSMVDLETQWLQLTRAVTEARQRQEQIEAQLFRADMQAGSVALGTGVQVQVIDPAYLPERPLPPGRTLLVLLFGGGGLALGLLVALLLALVDERVFDSRDLKGVATVLVEVPRATQRRTHATAT